jgi:hypothetical protein
MEESSTLALMIAEIAKVSNMPNLGPDTKLGEIDLDSLKFIELLLGFVKLYPGDTDLEQLSVDADTTLRRVDEQLRGLQVAD